MRNIFYLLALFLASCSDSDTESSFLGQWLGESKSPSVIKSGDQTHAISAVPPSAIIKDSLNQKWIETFHFVGGIKRNLKITPVIWNGSQKAFLSNSGPIGPLKIWMENDFLMIENSGKTLRYKRI